MMGIAHLFRFTEDLLQEKSFRPVSHVLAITILRPGEGGSMMMDDDEKETMRPESC